MTDTPKLQKTIAGHLMAQVAPAALDPVRTCATTRLHYSSCQLLGDAIRSLRLAPLVWEGAALPMLVIIALPLAETHMLLLHLV